jgi:fucose 4-O-acetylase-like acetyltransferase
MNQATMAAGSARSSTDWVVIAKGIGIILVVIGHFHPDASPLYWSDIRVIIYSFHMPLFFVLSGYLYVNGKYAYRELVKIKVRRLLYPFVSIAVGLCLIKFLAGRFVDLENPVDGRSIIAVVADPVNSYAPLLWFLQALFLIFCVYPAARVFLNDVLILLLFVILNEAFGSKYLVLGRVVANMPFFAFGVILRENPSLSKFVMGGGPRYLAVTLGIFVLGCGVQMSASKAIASDYVVQFVLGVVGTLLIVNVSHAIAGIADNCVRTILLRTGYYSMTIYFFHSMFEGAVRIGLLQIAHYTPVPFLVMALAAVTAGVVVPMPLEKYVIRKSRIARKLVLGLG